MPLMEMEHIKHGLLIHGLGMNLEQQLLQVNGQRVEHLIKMKVTQIQDYHIIQEELILIVQITLILDI